MLLYLNILDICSSFGVYMMYDLDTCSRTGRDECFNDGELEMQIPVYRVIQQASQIQIHCECLRHFRVDSGS